MLLFLVGLCVGLVASNFGGAVKVFALPRAALSAHLIALMQGTFLVLMGVLWPRLRLGRVDSRLACWLLIYGFLSAFAANMLAAILGAGGSMLPHATGGIHGGRVQEGIIAILLRTAAVSQIAAIVMVLWGLSVSDPGEPS